MKIFIMKLSLGVYSSIPFINAPISMGILLLFQTFLSTMMLSQLMKTSWMAMIMFLMFIGGLLILFMYMSSIASNEKFSFNMMLLIIPLMFMILPLEEMLMETQNSNTLSEIKSDDMISMTKIYNMKSMYITLFLFIYMFLTMIVITDVIKIFKGPLRSSKF